MNGAPLLSRRPAPDAIAARRTASGGKLQTLSMKFSLPPLSAEEQLTLSPWEKWQRYRRFPWKFLLQLVLLVLVTAQAMFYTDEVVPYFLDSDEALRSRFFGYTNSRGEWVSASGMDGSGEWAVNIGSKDDFQSAVEHITKTYTKFPAESVDEYTHVPTVEGDGRLGVQFEIGWNDASSLTPPKAQPPCGRAFSIPAGWQRKSNVSWAGFGPENNDPKPAAPWRNRRTFDGFDSGDWRAFFQRVESVDMSWALRDRDVHFLHSWRGCRVTNCSIDWQLQAALTFSSAGQMKMVFKSSQQIADVGQDKAAAKASSPMGMVTMWVALAMVAAVSLVLNVRSLRGQWKAAGVLRRYAHSTVSERIAEKKRASRAWLTSSIVQNVLNIWCTLRMSYPHEMVDHFETTEYILSASAFLTIVNTTRYLEFFPKYYVLMSTVAEGMPNVLRFIVGCMPLYLGYSVLGTVMFGRVSDDFASVRRTWVTLFSLLNGDSMLDVFDGVYTPGLGGLVSQVYLVTFICFFIYCAVNVFITIMADAFNKVHRVGGAYRASLTRGSSSLTRASIGGGASVGGAGAVEDSPRTRAARSRVDTSGGGGALVDFAASAHSSADGGRSDSGDTDNPLAAASSSAADSGAGGRAGEDVASALALELLQTQRAVLLRTREEMALSLETLDEELQRLDERAQAMGMLVRDAGEEEGEEQEHQGEGPP